MSGDKGLTCVGCRAELRRDAGLMTCVTSNCPGNLYALGYITPTPVPSEVAETTAGEREVEALAKVLRRHNDVPDGNNRYTTSLQDALFNVWAEADNNVGDYEIGERLAEAAIASITTTTSDWLAALLDRVRREEGERIAQAIEELPAHYVQSRRRGGTGWMQAVRTHEAVTIARAASVGRGEGL